MINASVTEVWAILMDFGAYKTWNPFIKSIEGKAKVGEQLRNTLQFKEGQSQVFRPIVLAVKPEQEFRWLGSLWLKGVFDGEHYFMLEEVGESQTRLIHGEQFSGLLSGILFALIGKDTKKNFQAMNQALKHEVEFNSVTN